MMIVIDNPPSGITSITLRGATMATVGTMTATIGTIGVGISPKEPAGTMTATIGTIGVGVKLIEANGTAMAALDCHLTRYGYSLALIGGIFPIRQITGIAREHIL